MSLISSRYKNDGKPILDLNDLQRQTIAAFKEKIQQGVYKEEQVPCDCDSTNEELLAEKDRYGIALRTVICKDCGLLRTNPRLADASLAGFYDHEYRKIYVGSEKIPTSYQEKEYKRGATIYDFIEKNSGTLHKRAHILEVGAGAGGNLVTFQKRGHEVLGIDLGTEYVEQGKSIHGVPLVTGTSASLLPQHHKAFDVIILCHALEHFTGIKKELETIKSLLAPGGIVYIEVPGIYHLRRSYQNDFLRYLQNAHNYHFTLGTLKQVMARYEFELIAGDEKIRSLFCHHAAYSLSQENHCHKISSFLHTLERKQELYKLQRIIYAGMPRIIGRILKKLFKF